MTEEDRTQSRQWKETYVSFGSGYASSQRKQSMDDEWDGRNLGPKYLQTFGEIKQGDEKTPNVFTNLSSSKVIDVLGPGNKKYD
jgi:hypothetical protein